MVAAVRLAEVSGTGVDRGLARLRLTLSEVQPEMVGRAQTTINAACAGPRRRGCRGRSDPPDRPGGGDVHALSLNAAYITNRTLGNDAGVDRPDDATLTPFCLRGSAPTSSPGGSTRSRPACACRPAPRRGSGAVSPAS